MPDADADLALLEAAVREAGAAAMGFFKRAARQWTKHDNSPVTEADMTVDRLLRARLQAARPDYGWLSEESEDDPARLTRRRIFIIDPIDGTRAFIAGEAGWAISAAVVEDGRSIAGALYAPVGDRLYAATMAGSFLNGQPVRVRCSATLAGATIGAPRGMLRAIGLSEEEQGFSRAYTKSLALRLAHVADGSFDAAFASDAAHDWDLAAAALIVEAAGGRIGNLDGRPLIFNAAEPRHRPVVAAGPALFDVITAGIRRHAENDKEATA